MSGSQPFSWSQREALACLVKGHKIMKVIDKSSWWTHERPSGITGTRCYGVHGQTYVALKRKDWMKMSHSETIDSGSKAFVYKITRNGVQALAEYDDWERNRRRRWWE